MSISNCLSTLQYVVFLLYCKLDDIHLVGPLKIHVGLEEAQQGCGLGCGRCRRVLAVSSSHS